MRSKFNLKEKGHPTPPTNVIQLQKGSAAPKIGSNEPYTEKLHQYAKKGIQFFSSKNHSGFFSSLTSEFAEKRAAISWPICYNFFFNVWTYKWSCGLDNSLPFQRRRNVMIHPNTWINVNNFLFDWTQFVVRIIHGFLVTLQFGHIFGVLLDRSALFTFYCLGFYYLLLILLRGKVRWNEGHQIGRLLLQSTKVF